MDTGMLWFDNSKTDLEKKIQAAVNHYKTKYGKMPTLCLVNTELLGDKKVALIETRADSKWAQQSCSWAYLVGDER
jgi:hypothetical protein